MIHGLFTGVALPAFFTPRGEDWRGARAVVDGADRAALIGEYARAIDEGLTYEAEISRPVAA